VRALTAVNFHACVDGKKRAGRGRRRLNLTALKAVRRRVWRHLRDLHARDKIDQSFPWVQGADDAECRVMQATAE
jgi:hypothetical protein